IMLLFVFCLSRSRCFTLFPYTTLFRSSEDDFCVRFLSIVMKNRIVLFVVTSLMLGGAGCQRASVPHVALPTASQQESVFGPPIRSEEHTSELQSPDHLVCRLLLEKKNT